MKKSKTSKSNSENGAANESEPDGFLIVGIGASAGGINALKVFFENVPADSDIAYVVILHLSPDHDSKLAEVLQTAAKIPVTQVTEKVRVEPNHVYVVPPNQSLAMADDHIIVSEIHTVEERRAPVDIFFRTLAESHRERAVSVVLSGTGANGSMGLKRVKERGGAVFVQNPREAEYNDMGRNAIATDLVDAVLNVADIPAKIIAYKKNRGNVALLIETEEPSEKPQNSLRDIFTHLRVHTGHDFSDYKRPTILRRIERRINVHNLSNIFEYADYLREHPEEVRALLKDLLISVTNFFRDKEAFAALEQEILPRVTEGKTAQDQIRVWIAGCATGEEAYSIAMLIAERILGVIDAPGVQIFATDIDDTAIAAAREGFYTLNDAADVSSERLRRFFTKVRNGYRIRREIREMVLFANHNLLKDPPFSRLDLVTCRNMLIYLNQAAQKRVMEIFHFALNPGGFLFLGSSESIDGASDLFTPLIKEHRIFQSRQIAGRIPPPMPNSLTLADQPRAMTSLTLKEQENRGIERLSFADLHQQLLEQFAPPSVVVNEEYEIIHLSERAGRYMRITGGEPSRNLLKVVREDLRLELRAALYQAVQKRINVEAENLAVKTDDGIETINILVRPVLRQDDAARGFILVLFEKIENAPADAEIISTSPEPIVRHLEEELAHSKARLRLSVEQYEVQTEELKASNEELQAINEELRSSTEELETSKEELHSINEELVTVNQELKIKIEELNQSNNDFQNLMNSTDIGTIFLDRDLRVKMFTPPVRQIVNLLPADIGRPLTDITNRFAYDKLLGDIETVLESLQPCEREIPTDDGLWFLLRILPYRTAQHQIFGVVLTFVNITERKRNEVELRSLTSRIEQQSRLFYTTLTHINDFAYIFDRDGRFRYANKPLLDLLGITLEEIIGKNFYDLNYPDDLAARLQKQIQNVFDTQKSVRDETPFINPAGQPGFYEYIFTPGFAADGKTVEFVAGSTRDITDRRKAENRLRESETRFRATFEQANVGIVQISFDGQFLLVNPGFCKIVGYSVKELQARNVKDISHPNDAAMEIEQNRRLMSGEITGYTIEKRYVHKNGGIVWGTTTATLVRKDSGEPFYTLAIIEDVTERKQAEEALRQSEERSRLLIESATDFAIFRITPDNLIASWNTGAEKVFGYTESEIIGQPGAILFTPEDREKDVPRKELETARENGRAEDERWHIRKDGSRFYASGVVTRLREGAEGFVKIARDQTAKIAAERAVREKEILQKLVGAQENERKRIARDLHDHLGQQLTALRLKLEAARKVCENDQICENIDEIQMIAKRLDADVDFFAWELRPAALDDLGLVAAIENYVREWTHYSGVTAEFHASGLNKTRLAPEAETNLYRIAQEALNNVYKHAEAKRVAVMLERRDGSVILIIEDDGIGFDSEDKSVRNNGIGLIGMRERAALVGGVNEIESSKGKGTTVFARVPIAESFSNEKTDENGAD